MEQTGSSNQGLGTNEFHTGMEQTAPRRVDAAHNTVDRIANAARPAVDRFAETAHQTVDRVSTFASSAAQTFQQKRSEYGTRSTEMIGDARTYVRENPMAAVGIAAAVGYVMSRLIKSR